MNQVTSLETKNDTLQSQLRIQNEQDIQEMYHDPFSSPSKSSVRSFNTSVFFSAGTTTETSAKAVTAPSATATATENVVVDNNSNSVHMEVTELRMKNRSLQNELSISEAANERLKQNLRSVEVQDKQKSDLLSALSKQLGESKARESNLQDELDACRDDKGKQLY